LQYQEIRIPFSKVKPSIADGATLGTSEHAYIYTRNEIDLAWCS